MPHVHVKKTTLRAMRISRSTNVSSCLAALSGSIIEHSPISFNNRTDTNVESPARACAPGKSLQPSVCSTSLQSGWASP